MLPLYEAKMIHLFDTRWATYEADENVRLLSDREKAVRLAPMPRYWVSTLEADRAWGERKPTNPYFAWRGIARTSDVRTAIGTLMPTAVPAGGNFDMVLGLPPAQAATFAAAFGSFVFDFVARQKLSNMHLQFSVAKQLPIPTPAQITQNPIPLGRQVGSWIGVRVDRLNAWIEDSGESAKVRAELDGFMCHMYGLSRSEVSHIMDTFPIVRRKDEAEFGSYRTKELIMEVYDAMAAAREQGRPYVAPWSRETV